MTLKLHNTSPHHSRCNRVSFATTLACGVLLVAGCVTPWERSALIGGRETTIDNVQGPNERRLRDYFWKKEQEDYLANGSLKPLAGTEDYLSAEELYEQEQYAEAGKAFRKVAKKYKKSEIREDAIFMEAESYYQLGHYADAQDEYSRLLRDFPSTRHLDDVSQRLFEIARMWLDFPEAAKVGEVEQVNYDNFGNKLPPETPPEKKQSWGATLWPNLTDESRPLFDPEGNGVGALRLIWLNDPTGPLADDALMLAASHYARTGNFIEADRHYTLLREEYPNSPHVQTAFVLGSHVKLMSYEGPNYDNKSLDDAEQLKKTILRLYPNSEDQQRVQDELKKIENAKAARDWEQVVFHERKNNARGQAIYCHLILQRHPNSPYAKLARERLQQLGPEYAGGQKLLQIEPDPPKYKQRFGNNGPQLSNIPTSLRNQQQAAAPRSVPATPAEDEPEDEEPAKPRRFLPWGSDEDAKPVPLPDSPGEKFAPAMPEQTVSGEAEETEGSRWSRLFRFTPPRRLAPQEDAKPIEETQPDIEETPEVFEESPKPRKPTLSEEFPFDSVDTEAAGSSAL